MNLAFLEALIGTDGVTALWTLAKIVAGTTIPNLAAACIIERLTKGEISCADWCAKIAPDTPLPRRSTPRRGDEVRAR